MGGAVANPGEEYESLYVTRVQVTDHSGQSVTRPGAVCSTVGQVCVNKVEQQLQIGRPLGRFSLTNNCQTFCSVVIRNSRTQQFADDVNKAAKELNKLFPPMNAL